MGYIAAHIVLRKDSGGFARYNALHDNKFCLIVKSSFKLLNQIPFEI